MRPLNVLATMMTATMILAGGCAGPNHKGATAMNRQLKTEEGYIQVTGGKVWYKMVGKGAPGLPLLVVHGGPGAAHDYLEPLQALADQRPVIFYDQLECGNSERPGRPDLWTLEHYVEEVHQIRTALDLTKMHILGQSWGATVAAEYALGPHREHVASLILSGPLLSTSRWVADQDAYIALMPPAVRDAIRASEASGAFTGTSYQEAMTQYYQKHVCRQQPWPDCLNRAMAKLNPAVYEHMWGPSEFTVTGILKDYERSDRLHELAMPVLLTCGQYDEAAPDTIQFFQSRIPRAEMRVFAEASHEHHLEKTGEYLAAAQEFLSRYDQEPRGRR